MGWSSGSALMSQIIQNLKKVEKDEAQRKAVYMALIPPFEDHDCDTLYECADDDRAFKKALKELGDD